MALFYADLVSESTSSYTTGAFTIATTGAWSGGYQNWANSGIAASATAGYRAVDSAGNTETGIGTYSSGSLARTTILTSNAGVGVAATFTGAVTLSMELLASKIVQTNGTVASGNLVEFADTTGYVLKDSGIPVASGLTLGAYDAIVTNSGSSLTTVGMGTNGYVLMGGTSGIVAGTLTAAAGISIVNGNGSVTIENTGIPAGSTVDLLAATGTVGSATTITASGALDLIGSTQGDILYRGASGWAVLGPGTSGYVLSTGGASANPSWVAAGGGGGSTEYYETWLTSGTSWTSPSWVTANTTFKAELVGGGGGSAGANNSAYAGGAGGAGAVCVITGTNLIAASTAYTIAIGAGGSAGAAGGAGGAGGATTLVVGATTYTANGGSGGVFSTTLLNLIASGGTASNGTLNLTGQPGFTNNPNNASAFSSGGSTSYGSGGMMAGSGGAQNGVAGNGYGSGAAGAKSLAASAQTGAAGGGGLIHIVVSGT